MTLVDPTGGLGYSYGQKLPSTHMSTLVTQQPNALDIVNGGTYELISSGSNLEITYNRDVEHTYNEDLTITAGLATSVSVLTPSGSTSVNAPTIAWTSANSSWLFADWTVAATGRISFDSNEDLYIDVQADPADTTISGRILGLADFVFQNTSASTHVPAVRVPGLAITSIAPSIVTTDANHNVAYRYSRYNINTTAPRDITLPNAVAGSVYVVSMANGGGVFSLNLRGPGGSVVGAVPAGSQVCYVVMYWATNSPRVIALVAGTTFVPIGNYTT